jgi:BA14K-like protein
MSRPRPRHQRIAGYPRSSDPAGRTVGGAECRDTPVETVQWRWRRGGWAPFAGAAIVGGAIAASRQWGYYNYYDNNDGDYAYAPGYRYGYGNSYGDYAYSPGYRYNYGSSYGDYAYSPGYRSSWGPSYTYESGGGDDVAYCQQRFRSYDPASGTYMGYDGQRHPCP